MERLMFGWDFEVDAWSRFLKWNLIKICIWSCDMNSTLGSVVPLAMFSKKNRIENPKSRWSHVESRDVLGCESSTTKRFPEALEKDMSTVQLKLETYLRTEWNLEVGGVLLPNTSWWSVGHYRLITLVQRIYLDSVEINFILIMMQ